MHITKKKVYNNTNKNIYFLYNILIESKEKKTY